MGKRRTDAWLAGLLHIANAAQPLVWSCLDRLSWWLMLPDATGDRDERLNGDRAAENTPPGVCVTPVMWTGGSCRSAA